MTRVTPRRIREAGFALILTLGLVALLVLAVLALSVLVRVSGQVSTAGGYRTQARQNALLGLGLGLGALQQHAGADSAITGMAGIAGVPAGSTSTTRYWCGVWRADGAFVAWLTSGAVSATSAGADTIELISSGSVGSASSTSANVENEHVIAGKIPIVVAETVASPGTSATVGKYAYLVIDEGTKISAYAAAAERPISEVAPVMSAGLLTNQLKLRTALSNYATKLPDVLSYEQLALLPTPTSSALTPLVLQDTFHYVTLTSRTVAGSSYASGTININTASTLAWRCILDTYNAAPGVTTLSDSAVTSSGLAMGNAFAGSSSGKALNGPFLSVAAFGGSSLLADNLPSPITPEQFMSAIGNLLTVRSDTFRIRAYGEALNPVDATKIESVAYCEAMVQRTTEMAPNGLGRRFVITYFRWLGPDDI